jgi:ribonuclease Z
MSAQLATLPQLKPVAEHHTSPEQAGEVFSRVKPGLAVFSHIVALGVTPAEIARRARSAYQGQLEVGDDLMRFTIGDGVTVKRWDQELRKHPD